MDRRGCRPRSSAVVLANHSSQRRSHSINKGWIIGLDSPQALRAWLLSACPSGTKAIRLSKRLTIILALMGSKPWAKFFSPFGAGPVGQREPRSKTNKLRRTSPSQRYHSEICERLCGQGLPFRLSIVAGGGNLGHRRDAYDTFGSATCVKLRPSEKYHRRPACASWSCRGRSSLKCPNSTAPSSGQ
jgi:hypothetical protein